MYENYEKLLKRLGITSYKVSKYSGVSQSVISSWKNGLSTPKRDKMQKIAEYLGVSIDYLYGNVEDPNEYLEESRAFDFTYDDAINLIIDYLAKGDGEYKLSATEKKELRDEISELSEIAYIRLKKRKS